MNKATKMKDERKLSVFQWILYAGIIPVITVSAILLIVLTLTGHNFFKEAEKLPIIGNLFSSKEQASSDLYEEYERELNELRAQLKDEQLKNDEMEKELEEKEQEIAELEAENEGLKEEINTLLESNSEERKNTDSMIKTFEKMSPKNAANILIQMDETTALNMMANLREQTLADILEKMPPSKRRNFRQVDRKVE